MARKKKESDLKKIRNFIERASRTESQKLGPDFWQTKKFLDDIGQKEEPDFTLTSSEINAYLG